MEANILPNNIAELKQLLLKSHQEQQLWKEKYESLLESFKLAKQRQFASSSETHLLQDSLFDEADTSALEEEGHSGTAIEVAAHQRKTHPKRQPIPKHFPREKIWCDLPDSEKTCGCGCQKIRIGEEISEQLDVIPPSFKVMQYIRPKYSCKKCQIGVSIAKLPPLLLPKCIAAPGLVAYTITAKYVDHLPLYRQEQLWQRYGVDLPRNTLCGWLMKTADKCEILWNLIAEHILSGNYIQADESPVQVLGEPNRRDQQKSYIWVYRGGPPGKTGVYFVYQETRSGQHAQEFLKSFKGYLQTDGYKGYDWMDDHPDMIHLACMAHARRPFAELVKLSKKAGKSHEAIKFIEKLYAIEEEARALSAQDRYQLRLQQAKPKLDKIKLWLDKSSRGSPPKGKLGKAIQYMLDRWNQLNHYLLDGQLQIDNNLIENDIRLFALGKKNWLFKGSPRGAKAGAIFYSLIKSAQANQLEPYQYLRYMLTKLPLCQEKESYVALLPWNLTADTIKT